MAQTLYPLVVSSAQIDPQVAQSTLFNLSSANILAMNGAPVTILAAPGAGKALVVESILFEFTAGTQYANGGAVNFQYHSGSATSLLGAVTIPAATITSASNSNTLCVPIGAANGFAVTANTGVDITNATAPFITGTGTAKIFINYYVITL